MHVETVRDLALWPPYRAAAAIVDRTLNPDPPHPDSEAPSDLVPATGRYPTDRIFDNAHVLVPPHADDRPDVHADGGHNRGTAELPPKIKDLATSGPVDLSGSPRMLTTPRHGAVLTFAQSWFPVGTALGQLLYSLPLAPGESTKLAVVDWRRRTNASLDEAVSQTESLTNTMTQSRAVAEVASAVVKEVQSGTSEITTDATSGSIGAGGGAVLGGPALVGGTAAASASSATTTGVFTSTGERGVTAEMQQFVSDATHQQAFSSRNRHAATVSEAYAEERRVNLDTDRRQLQPHARADRAVLRSRPDLPVLSRSSSTTSSAPCSCRSRYWTSTMSRRSCAIAERWRAGRRIPTSATSCSVPRVR